MSSASKKTNKVAKKKAARKTVKASAKSAESAKTRTKKAVQAKATKAKTAKAKAAKAKAAKAKTVKAKTAKAKTVKAKTVKAKTVKAKTVKAKTVKAKTAGRKTKAPRRGKEDPSIFFAPLCEGERADVLRVLLDDRRLAAMAKVGRYRVVAIDPMAFKEGHVLAKQRVARVVVFDYSSAKCVEANVNLDTSEIVHLLTTDAQPMLACEEEINAMAIAMNDEVVCQQLALGDEAIAAMHYWSDRTTELSYNRRSAAVLLADSNGHTQYVAVVDLLDAQVTELVPAELW